MIVSERSTRQGLLVTVCDDAVLGETFEEGDVSLEVTESFYGGREADPDAVRDLLGRASIANLVGAEAVDVAIDGGFVDPENVLHVDETVHAQYLRM